MNNFFHELGRTVRARWSDLNFALAPFPALAHAALLEKPPAEHVELAALMREFLLQDEQPPQSASGFGQPELIVFQDPRFYIQVLFWLDGTTDIHQHEFSGAFHVMAGSSLHSRFVFEHAQPISAHLRTGTLRMTDTHLLPKGSSVPIVSGSGQIHSLFHLETPSVSVVIRTHSDPGTGPQFTYLPPHLAVDPFQEDTLTTRRKQLLDVLERTGDPEYPKLVLQMLAALDFERGFFILQNGIAHLRQVGAWDECLQVFAKKHGQLAEYVAPTLEEIVRRDALAELRRSVTQVEHRFFLALLLNVPGREDLLALVEARFSGSPLETVMRWIEELLEVSPFGGWLLDAELPGGLGSDETLESLRQLLTELGPAAEKPISPAQAAIRFEMRETLLASSLRSLVPKEV